MSKLSPRRRPPLPQVVLHRRQVRRMVAARVGKRSRTSPVLAKLNSFATWDGWTKLGVLVAVVGLLFTQQSVGVSQKQVDLAEQAQINDLMSKGTEQLASKVDFMRVAAIQALQSLVIRWPEQKSHVNNILGNFVQSGLPAESRCTEITAPDLRLALNVVAGVGKDGFYPILLVSSRQFIVHAAAGRGHEELAFAISFVSPFDGQDYFSASTTFSLVRALIEFCSSIRNLPEKDQQVALELVGLPGLY